MEREKVAKTEADEKEIVAVGANDSAKDAGSSINDDWELLPWAAEDRIRLAEERYEDLDFGDDSNDGNKDGTFIRNGKTYRKTELKHIYEIGYGEYGYRIYVPAKKANTYVTKDENKRPFTSAQKAYDAMILHLHAIGEDVTFENRKTSFDEQWNAVLKRAQDKKTKDAATLIKYKSIYNIHIKDKFGKRALRDITVDEYNEYLADMYINGDGKGNKLDGYSFTFVESILKFIFLVVSEALKDRVVDAAYYTIFKENIHMPAADKADDNEDFRVLTQEELLKIKDLLKDTDLYIPFLVSSLCGCRPAETFALCWEDVNFKEKTIQINKQITTVNRELILKEPKMGRSGRGKRNPNKKAPGYRTINMPDLLCKELKKKHDEQEAAKTESPTLFEANRGNVTYGFNHRKEVKPMPNFICRDRNGKYVPATAFQYYAKIIRKDICPNQVGKEDFSFYSFRKTFLSNMAANNCPIGELMRIAGHAKVERLYQSYYATTEMAEKKRIEATEETAKILG